MTRWFGEAEAAPRTRQRRCTFSLLLGLLLTLVLVVPSAARAGGQMLVYTGNGAINEGYAQFAAAAGRTEVTSPVLPITDAEWDSYSCVVLPINTVGFTLAQRTSFNSYMNRGGTVVALAEHLNADPGQTVGPASVTTMNNLASGTGIQGLNTTRNQGPTVTFGVPASKYTQGVTRVGFAATSTLTVTAPAVTLVNTVTTEVVDPPPAPFVALRELGSGKFVYSGDSSLFSGAGGGFYSGNDNANLARNICGDINPPTITITTPQDGAHYKKGAASPAAWTCTDPDSDLNPALTAATTPVGEPIDTNVPGTTTATKSFSVSCTDNAGNSATKTVSYTVDGTPPTVVIDTPIDGGTYNRNSSVPADWHCEEIGGPADIDTAPDKTFGTVAPGASIDTLMPLGGAPVVKSFSVTCADKAGNTATKLVSYTVEDQNPPIATITSPLDGARFTIGKSVLATWTCADADGPQDIDADENKTFGTVPVGQAIDTSGVVGQTVAKAVTVVCADLAGNVTTKTHTYYIDGNPPVVTITVPLDGGSYPRGSSEPANWGCTDPDGDADIKTKVATLPVGTPINTGTAGSKAFSVTCTDQAGNAATKVVTYSVLDTTAPQITVTVPAEGGTYERSSSLVADYSCVDPDGPADVKTCSGPVADGVAIDTSSLGSKTFTVNAEDQAGNPASKTVHYTVVGTSAPQITVTVPGEGGTYARGATVVADYACTDADGPADVTTCAGPVASGAAIDTATTGSKTFKVTASDQAGNPRSKTVTYTVIELAPASGTPPPTAPPATSPPTGPAGSPPLPTPDPSLGPSAVGPGGALTLTFTIPSAGELVIRATTTSSGAARTLTFANATRTVQAGVVKLKLKPTRAAKRLLDREKRLRVKVRSVFTPTGGGRATVLQRTITVRVKS